MRATTHALVAVLIALLFTGCGANPPAELQVYAPPTMLEAMEEIAELYRSEAGVIISLNLASSGILAQQIMAGAPADVFISAHPDWMDEVQRAGFLAPGTRSQVAGNKLVVIVPAGTGTSITSLSDLTSPAVERIAIADPSHAPAGMYAREALRAAGVWNRIVDKILPALNARAASSYVERGEADAGIVNQTDARVVPGVDVAFEIPPALQPLISFQAAAIDTADPLTAHRFLDFLRGPRGQRVLRRFGFEPPGDH